MHHHYPSANQHPHPFVTTAANSHHHLPPCLLTYVPLQFVREFAKLGLTRSVGGVLALALARELTPVVTAIILAGRVGSAFAAELGTMQVSRYRANSSRPLMGLFAILMCCGKGGARKS